MIRVSGIVSSEGTRRKLPAVVIKATSAGGEVLSTTSDEDGNFAFREMESGEWTFLALKEGYLTSKSQKLDLAADKKDLRFELALAMEKGDEKAGRIFFYITLGGLIALIVTYIVLHLVFPATGKASQGSFLWGTEPLRFVEVLFWGMAGVLVDKLMSIGWYLRRGTFYRSGILMHIAQIISVPLLVMVVVFLLSLATLSVTLTSGNAISLDLSDPRLLVAVAFIIGSRPWDMQNFIRKTSEKITRGQGE